MVFPGGLVKSSIINVNPPTILNASRNQVVLLIFNHNDSRFPRDHMYRTHPTVVRNRINNTCLYQLGDFLLQKLHQLRI